MGNKSKRTEKDPISAGVLRRVDKLTAELAVVRTDVSNLFKLIERQGALLDVLVTNDAKMGPDIRSAHATLLTLCEWARSQGMTNEVVEKIIQERHAAARGLLDAMNAKVQEVASLIRDFQGKQAQPPVEGHSTTAVDDQGAPDSAGATPPAVASESLDDGPTAEELAQSVTADQSVEGAFVSENA